MRRLHHRASAWKKRILTKAGEKGVFEKENVKSSSSMKPDKRCEYCQVVSLDKLFFTEHRSPDVDGDYLKEVNTLENLENQNDCPFCRLLLQLISSSVYTLRDPNGSVYKPNAIYIEAQRNDFALCGIEVQPWDTVKKVASCIHVQVGLKIMEDKIILCDLPEIDKTSQHPFYSIVKPLGIQVDFSSIKEWISDCESGHSSSCSSLPIDADDPAFRACTRVIDVRLRQIIHADLGTTKYAALTYVWGNYSPQLQNIEARALPSQLPATFEDAIAVCLQLDIPCLWIDMFCIDQTDETDKKIQVPHMDAIYDGAFLTIVAIEGTNPLAGLPRVRPSPDFGIRSQRVSSHNLDYQLAIVPGFFPPTTTWNSRAWTLQEALMSKRLLVFNQRYVSFYCRTTVCREDLKHALNYRPGSLSQWQGLPTSPFSNDYYRSKYTIAAYTELARLYTSRSLSDPMDALAAVSGILNTWSRTSSMEFVAGIPTDHLTDALIWYGSDYSSRGHQALPSWSWAAWKGDISYPYVVQKSTPSGKDFGTLLDLVHNSENLPARIVGFYEPNAISFGTLVEEEALISIYTNRIIPQLQISSYITKFRLPLITLEAYKGLYHSLKSYNELIFDSDNKPLNTMALVSSESDPEFPSKRRLAVMSSPYGYRCLRLYLPNSLPEADEQRLRNEDCEFILLKRWHMPRESASKRRYRVWALLIMRDEERGVAKSMGCIAMHSKVWELGNPTWATVVLE